MKTQKLTIMAILLISAFLISNSCKKYEEGPLLSFRSAEKRVINNWKYDYVSSGDIASDISSNSYINFEKDGKFEGTTYSGYKIDNGGTWQLTDNNKYLKIAFFTSSECCTMDNTYNFEIIKLKEKEMWLKDNNYKTVWHLKE